MTSQRAARLSRPPGWFSEETQLCEAYLFYFPTERQYSILSKSSTYLPRDVHQIALKTSVDLLIKGVRCTSVLIAKGSTAELLIKQQNLETRLMQESSLDVSAFCANASHNRTQSPMSSSSTSVRLGSSPREHQRQVFQPNSSVASDFSGSGHLSHHSDPELTLTEETHEVEVISGQDNKSIVAALEKNTAAVQEMSGHLISLLNVCKGIKKDVKKCRANSEQPANDDEDDENRPEVLHNEQDLVRIQAPTPSDFGIKLARALFTEDELAGGILGQLRQRANSRPPLDPERAGKAMSAIKARYPRSSDRQIARGAFNQLGLDHKKRKSNADN